MKKAGVAWLDRRLLEAGFIGLCISESAFYRELRKLKLPVGTWPEFTAGTSACVHYFTNKKQRRMAIVCIKPKKSLTLPQHYALLTHEAVHIWQNEMRERRETKPGDEIEAYGIQSIAQALFVAFARMRRR